MNKVGITYILWNKILYSMKIKTNYIVHIYNIKILLDNQIQTRLYRVVLVPLMALICSVILLFISYL